ncbi:unnamed protein product [Moneuplotes crassus]|uniref:Uncharacterized protein n=1 Tax=Euplotes crassus TaxID=5936 RepID=A0AAD1XSB8_EUPCR|nr:unnamed protein product [Moneuplotes crassus]
MSEKGRMTTFQFRKIISENRRNQRPSTAKRKKVKSFDSRKFCPTKRGKKDIRSSVDDSISEWPPFQNEAFIKIKISKSKRKERRVFSAKRRGCGKNKKTSIITGKNSINLVNYTFDAKYCNKNKNASNFCFNTPIKVDSKVISKVKEVVVPSLQNFKTDPKLFFSPKNVKSLKKLFESKHYKYGSKREGSRRVALSLKSSKKDTTNKRITSACRDIDKKHQEEGIMRRNKLLIEHVIQQRIKNQRRYEPFSARRIIF